MHDIDRDTATLSAIADMKARLIELDDFGPVTRDDIEDLAHRVTLAACGVMAARLSASRHEDLSEVAAAAVTACQQDIADALEDLDALAPEVDAGSAEAWHLAEVQRFARLFIEG